MIRGTFWDLHDDATLAKIDQAAVRLLTHSGVRIHHEGLLDSMAAIGCRIDKPALRCYFTEPLIRKVIDHFRGKGSGDVEFQAAWNPQQHMGLGGTYPHLLDWPSGQRRLATRQDVVDMTKMAHVLPEFRSAAKVLQCAQVDQRIEPLWAALTMFELTDKPIGGGETFEVATIEPLVRMAEVLSGKPDPGRLLAGCDFFISPLIFDRKQAEVFLEKRRLGLSIMPGSMTVSGMSGPVTIPGTVAISLAEMIAGWAFGYAVSPQLPASGIIASGSMDMRTLAAHFGSPEALLQDLTVVQICRRLYGIAVYSATGYVDCKRPGIEATFEKMFVMSAAPMGVGMFPGGGGLLSAGQDYCPVQHYLDQEISKAVERFYGHYEVSDESLALDLTERMIASGTTDFLQTDHTLAHYAEHWYPQWFDRSLWQGPDHELHAERRMLERIDTHIKDAIARYERPAIDQAKLAELKNIYAAAEKTILR